MNLSKNDRAIIAAHIKGYKIFEDGIEVISPYGVSLKLQRRKYRGKGYYYNFNISFEGETCPIRLHRFQAYQKYGDEIFKENIVVRHKDNNSENNSYENIILGTQSENQYDRPADERFLHAVLASSYMKKYDDDFLSVLFKDRYENGLSYNSLRDKYNIAKSQLSYLFNKSLFSKNYQIPLLSVFK